MELDELFEKCNEGFHNGLKEIESEFPAIFTGKEDSRRRPLKDEVELCRAGSSFVLRYNEDDNVPVPIKTRIRDLANKVISEIIDGTSE